MTRHRWWNEVVNAYIEVVDRGLFPHSGTNNLLLPLAVPVMDRSKPRPDLLCVYCVEV